MLPKECSISVSFLGFQNVEGKNWDRGENVFGRTDFYNRGKDGQKVMAGIFHLLLG